MITKSDWIEADLESICSSADFATSPRLVRLLRFCVEQSRLNRFDNLKESTIGVAVFDRQPGYNTKDDPIVRVSAARLRKKLDAFYQTREPGNAVIEIPKGSYVALFHRADRASEAETVTIVEPANLHASLAGEDAERVGPILLSRRVLAIAASTALIAGIVWFSFRHVRPSSPPTELLAALPGAATDPAWSHDGETLAFAWNGGAVQPTHIYLLRRGDSVPVRLTGSDRREYRPVWSPDGRQIALLRETSADHVELVVVNGVHARAARTEQIVRTTAQPASAMSMTALDWSSDGKWWVSSEGSEGGGSRHLVLISTADGSSSVLTDPPVAVTGDVEARFSPDSQKIAFRRGGEGTLFVLSLAGHGNWQPTQLTELNSGVRGITWSGDGTKIYFGSQQNQGYFGLWSVPANGGTPTPLVPGVNGISPTLNANHHTIAFSQQQIDQNLWLYPVDLSHLPRILVPSTAVESAPAFSPDGTKFAFVSSRSGALEVWISGINDATPRRVTALADARVIGTPSWSPDGLSVVYPARRQGRNVALQTNFATSATTALRKSDTYSNWPQLSADGSSLYFVSNAGHDFRLWRQFRSRPETAEPVLPELVTSFRLAADRSSLYYIRSSAQALLMRVDLATRQESRVFAFPEMPAEINAWDVAAGQLFYVTFDSSRCLAHVIAVALNGGNRRSVGQFPIQSVEHWQPGISAAPDGSSVIVAQTDRDDASLMSVRLN